MFFQMGLVLVGFEIDCVVEELFTMFVLLGCLVVLL